MKQALPIRVFCLLAALAIATVVRGEGVPDSIVDRKERNALTIAPLTLFNPDNPALQFGYQRDLPGNWMFAIDVGPILRRSVFGAMEIGKSWNKSYSGYVVKVDVSNAYYVKKVGRPAVHTIVRAFVGAHFLYAKNNGDMQYREISGGLFVPRTTIITKFHQRREKTGLCVIGGLQLIPRQFIFEVNAGLGMARFNVLHTHKDENYDDADIRKKRDKEGRYYKFDATLMIKLGVRF